jgi:transposase
VATIAVAHSILVAAYHILDELVPYHDLGGDWFIRRQSLEHRARGLVRQLFLLGYEVSLEAPRVPEEEAA